MSSTTRTTELMKFFRISALCAVVLIALITILGKGGGDGGTTTSPTTPTSPEGLWNGTTDDGRTIAGLVLDDGTYWFIYSPVGNSTLIAGVVQGDGAGQNGSFTSADARDFNLEGLGVIDGTISGNYVERQSLDGTTTYPSLSDQVIFTSTYDTDYDLTPSLSIIEGTYTGAGYSSGGVELVFVTIFANGTLSGNSAGGCSYTGSVSTRASGNVYDVAVTFEGGVCVNGTATIDGIGYFDAASNIVTTAGLNNTRTDGFLFRGVKPDAQGDQSDLLKKIAETGELSVIVGLKLPPPGFVPEGTLTAAEIAQQRETIAVTREAVLDSLGGFRFTMYASWESLPSVALDVDVTTLKALIDSPYVTTIQEDESQFAD